jgi:DMSO/TMAO reductase YedYZ molybdopterin-dependent catalytic subunit
MKQNRVLLVFVSLVAVLALTLAACGQADNGPVTLTVNGMVKTELQLTDAGLHKMDVVTLTLEHPKNGPTEYSGVRLNDLLDKAGVQSGATTVTLTASDGYTYDIDLATVQACSDCLVAFDAANPGVYSSAMPDQASKAWVKNLVSIEVK